MPDNEEKATGAGSAGTDSRDSAAVADGADGGSTGAGVQAGGFTDTDEADATGDGSGAGNDGGDAGAQGGTGTDAGDSGGQSKDDGDTDEDGAAKGTDKRPWKNDKNAEAAKRRRENERRAAVDAARAEADTAAVLEALGGVNPFTGGAMKDAEDVRVWRAMSKIKASGGDPVTDYAGFVANENRQAAAERKAEAERQERAERDWQTFRDAHPDVSWEQLTSDKRFMSFARGKLGTEALSDIYSEYRETVAEAERQISDAQARATERAAQAIANAKASPGSATGDGGGEDKDFFTFEQVRAMSHREAERNYEKIMKSMEKW